MEICWWVDTNGVPAMVESRSGFQKKFLSSIPHVCMLAIEKKCSKTRLCDMNDEGRNKDILWNEN